MALPLLTQWFIPDIFSRQFCDGSAAERVTPERGDLLQVRKKLGHDFRFDRALNRASEVEELKAAAEFAGQGSNPSGCHAFQN